ncbi:MAG: Gldg family protein [Bacteroidota bacterium]
MRITKSIFNQRLLLFLGIFVLLNLLANQTFFRLDFTADKRYTLSEATKNILTGLEEPVTITVYRTKQSDLPPALTLLYNDVQDLLVEFQNRSGGQVEYEFINPNESEEKEVEIQRLGIFPFQINSVENDRQSQIRAYFGAIAKKGSQQELIPVFQNIIRPDASMEYDLAAAIKKLGSTERAKIGILQGHGEPNPQLMAQAMQELQNLYQLDTLSLSSAARWAEFKTILMMAPTQPVPPEHLAQLDQFLAGGGRLLVGLNAVDGDLSQRRPWDKINTGVDEWLAPKGIQVEPVFATDTRCDNIPVPVQQGPFQLIQQIPFVYYPLMQAFPEHPITEGLEAVSLKFASPITYASTDSSLKMGTLATTSAQSGKKYPPATFDPNDQDFPYREQVLAMWAEGKMGGENEAKMVVIGDGDFATNGPPQQQQQLRPDNVNFLINAIDWLTDDTGLIELRTKGVTTRTIDKQLEDSEKTIVKYLNFLLPILIVVVFGIFWFQRRRLRKAKWMATDFR